MEVNGKAISSRQFLCMAFIGGMVIKMFMLPSLLVQVCGRDGAVVMLVYLAVEICNLALIAYLIKKYPDQLSGGMRQRVALIRTLVSHPKLLLLDEPFSALDYQTRLSVADDVYKIIRGENKTAILVTHDISEAISLSDRVIVLTKRPAKVKNVYDITLSADSPLKRRELVGFSKWFEILYKELINDD